MPGDSSSDSSNSNDTPSQLKKDENEENPVLIGPALPPHLTKNLSSQDEAIGPKLPPQFTKQSSMEDSFGPQLPPHLLKSSETKVTIGPSLPPHLRKQLQEQANNEVINNSDDEDDCYGPLPPGAGSSASHIALEERALQMRIDKLEPDKNEPVRETWMTELPEAKASQFGLGPRQFRKQAGPDMSDRSAWTDIAGEKTKRKEKKVDLKAEAERKELEKRDEEYEKVSKKHKRKAKSLVEMHQEKVKKTSEESTERRPFSRDTDLQVNKFDEAQKKAILKKAQLLDDRFSSGKSKYL